MRTIVRGESWGNHREVGQHPVAVAVAVATAALELLRSLSAEGSGRVVEIVREQGGIGVKRDLR
jgi:hypothetical protein